MRDGMRELKSRCGVCTIIVIIVHHRRKVKVIAKESVGIGIQQNNRASNLTSAPTNEAVAVSNKLE